MFYICFSTWLSQTYQFLGGGTLGWSAGLPFVSGTPSMPLAPLNDGCVCPLWAFICCATQPMTPTQLHLLLCGGEKESFHLPNAASGRLPLALDSLLLTPAATSACKGAETSVPTDYNWEFKYLLAFGFAMAWKHGHKVQMLMILYEMQSL